MDIFFLCGIFFFIGAVLGRYTTPTPHPVERDERIDLMIPDRASVKREKCNQCPRAINVYEWEEVSAQGKKEFQAWRCPSCQISSRTVRWDEEEKT